MGPRLVSRGRTVISAKHLLHSSLQWGRGLLAAEGSALLASIARGEALQWGRGLLAAEGWEDDDEMDNF